MAWLALGVGALLLVIWLGHVFASAPVETVKKLLVWVGGLLGAVLLVALLFSGRGAQALWTFLLIGPLLWRLVQSWRAAWQFGRQPGSGGAETSVETATLHMRLDHASGQMSGRVRRGELAGRELAELDLPELLSLLRECTASDPESVPLLEAWLDRVAPEWREAGRWGGEGAGGGAGGRSAGSGGKMSRAEALAVLGLAEGATPAEIRAAHRRLMRGAHPDQGGSDWLAARINQARDVLLP